ncbi:methyltransferase type 11 [Candidatus Woesearchaeota archaeon]|nr:methyltransferase type 11 [Candidatus Woesearchaeota archaeon]|tara:strand:+ start:49 stop:792 length:744 start_codon:yes stop_codon:yes gene_type:complete
MNLKKLVVDEFSTVEAQEVYFEKGTQGLWGSERALVKKYFPKKCKVLDIGCGTGRTTLDLHKMGYKVTGVDLTPMMIENANIIARQQKQKIPYEVGDATKLRFKDNSFDAALFSNNGWTQIPGSKNRLKALQEARRVLKPDGVFWFTTHRKTYRGFTLFWIGQWLKQYVAKPLGFKILEEEFGDRFFEREAGGTFNKQYIHIPSLQAVRSQIEEAGFELVLNANAREIFKKQEQLFPPMMYVCKPKV